MPRRKRRRNPRLGAGLLAIALVALFIGGAVFYNRIMASRVLCPASRAPTATC